MEILHLTPGKGANRLETLDALPDNGFVWLDFDRDAEPHWAERLCALAGVAIDDRHVQDSLNPAHPSYYEGTADYEMVIFRGLAPGEAEGQFMTRPTAFFLLDRLLVTVRPPGSRSIGQIARRLLEGRGKIPDSPVALMHLVLNTMVDRFLALREPLSEEMERWREDLLDPNSTKDWRAVMGLRSQLLRLTLLCEEQEDAVQAWREETAFELDPPLTIRFNDLLEHVRRVTRFADAQQKEIESMVQLHFSAVAHRTNEVMRVLTVLSAIFLPLGLVAGIFGMNFEHMPELRSPYGYYLALLGMALLGLGLLGIFRLKRWV